MAEQQYTREQLVKGLERAHLDGNTEAARAIANRIVDMDAATKEAEQQAEQQRQEQEQQQRQQERQQRLQSYETPNRVPIPTMAGGAATDPNIDLTPPEQSQSALDPNGQPYQSFTEATGAALSNVPERFQQSYAGLVQMVGETMNESRLRDAEIRAERLGISTGDYFLLGWAGNNGLIDKDMAIPEALDYVKQNIAQSLTPEQLEEVAGMGIVNPQEIAQYATDLRAQAQETMEPVNAKPGSAAYYGSAAIGSTAEMVPALLAAAVTRNPQVAMTMIGGQVAGQEYAAGREQGLSVDEAQTLAVMRSAAEAIPEYLPLSLLLKPGASVWRRMGNVTVANTLQETLTEAINIGIDAGYLEQDMTWSEARGRLVDAGIIGGISGPLMQGVTQPVQAGRDFVRRRIDTPERQLGRTMMQDVEGAQWDMQRTQEFVRNLFNPNNAQVRETVDKPISQMVQEQLETPAVNREEPEEFAPQPEQMPDDVNVPMDVPQQHEQPQQEQQPQLKGWTTEEEALSSDEAQQLINAGDEVEARQLSDGSYSIRAKQQEQQAQEVEQPVQQEEEQATDQQEQVERAQMAVFDNDYDTFIDAVQTVQQSDPQAAMELLNEYDTEIRRFPADVIDGIAKIRRDIEGTQQETQQIELTEQQRKVERDLTKRIDNAMAEPEGSENRRIKVEVAQRGIERADLPQQAKDALIERLGQQQSKQPRQQEDLFEPNRLEEINDIYESTRQFVAEQSEADRGITDDRAQRKLEQIERLMEKDAVMFGKGGQSSEQIGEQWTGLKPGDIVRRKNIGSRKEPFTEIGRFVEFTDESKRSAIFEDWQGNRVEVKEDDVTGPGHAINRAIEGRQKAAQREVTQDEPEQLDTAGEGTLERVSADQVQEATQEQETGRGAQGRSRTDVSGGQRTGAGRVQPTGGMGDGQGEIPVSTGRKERTTEPTGPSTVTGDQQRDESGVADAEGNRGNRTELEENAGEATPPQATNTAPVEADKRAAPMFTITDQAAITEGGAKTKFKNNLAAIKTLKEIQEAGRQATPEEQAIMAKYVGWGGLPQAFVNNGKTAKGWDKEAKQLQEVLTEDEYAAARRSTQDAHYTSYEIVSEMWNALKQFGFQGGRVLEPSVGSGNFIGIMPGGIRSKSNITAVELDPITGGIAKLLYPRANVQAPMGFQDIALPENYFDVAIGNPPFGSQKLYDKRNKDLSKFSIHNFFFAKSLNAVKENGVLAMVVSNYLMDSQSNKVAREWLAERADLLGAIRLPNNAFLDNAGTEVTTDIIFLRKRAEGTPRKGPSWARVQTVKDKNGNEVALNEYFVENSDNMLGEFGAYGSMYGPDMPALVARDGQNTAELLRDRIASMPKQFMDSRTQEPVIEEVERTTNVDGVKVGSMFIQDGEVRIRLDDKLGKPQSEVVEMPNEKARKRVMGMIEIRDAFTDLRKAQLTEGVKDAALDALRQKLNKVYDKFVKANGPINHATNQRLFRDDPSYPQISALENNYEKGITPAMAKKTGEKPRKPSAEKAAIFFKRTQSPYKPPEKVSTAKDALTSSLSERGFVDMAYMEQLYGKSDSVIANELGDLLFESAPGVFETRDQFLSGNVREKLAQAKRLAEKDKKFYRNVEALEEVQPTDIEAVDISVKPGAGWLGTDTMTEFAKELAGVDFVQVIYNPQNAQWSVSLRGSDSAESQWGTSRVPMAKILENAMNQKQSVVRDKNPDGTSIVNEAATNAANEKIERVKAEFRRWIWKDEARRNKLVRKYNDTYNTDRQREYDGSHLTFPGKIGDDIIKLRPHQANAVWRMMQSGTVLLDHVVGAGKTFTMIAGAMEMRRIGKAKKPMFVVPNHLVGQWAADFTRLYPGANVLQTTKKDFEKNNRKRLFARIATGDWDAVIVAHSSFGKVDVDAQFKAEFIKEQIREHEQAIQSVREQQGKKDLSVKQIEKSKERLEEKLEKLIDEASKDDSLTFAELGVDAIFLDEAHEFKNLAYTTTMQRVGGLGNPQGSQKAMDLFMKIRYTLERTGGSNVVFATGTPISNTMAEMFTMQRYLDYDTLKAQGIGTFDAWANMYGEVVTDWELSPSGNYKLNSRFSKFVNIPELMQKYLSFADVINRDDINRQLQAQGKRLPVPKIKGDKPENIIVERSDDQADYIGVPEKDERGNEVYPQGSLVWRAENLPKKPEKGADNMLKIMSDARKAALDMRMIDPTLYGDFDGSKINRAAESIKDYYDRWNEDRGTQLVFIDLSTPKGAKAKEAARIRDLIERADDGDESAQNELDKLSPDELDAIQGDFSVYDDLRQKLINMGIPDAEIAFIHDANTELQKEELFGKVNSGRVRVLLGSTAKMGAGMNVQERLVALHHIDAPWRPSDLEQREGRIIRQGNRLYERDPDGFEVGIFRYATKNTLDSRMWQTIETKARFIEQVRKGNTKDRTIEDLGGEASNAAEMKAASSGNPLILEEMDLRQKIRKLEQLESEHDREQFTIQDTIRQYKRTLERDKQRLGDYVKDEKVSVPKEFTMMVNGKTYDKRADAGAAMLKTAKQMADSGKDTQSVGKYGGFELILENLSGVKFVATLKGAAEHQIEIDNINEQDAGGLATKVANAAARIPQESKRIANRIQMAKAEIPKLEAQIGEFQQADELTKLKSRHALVIAELKPAQKKEDADPEEEVLNSMGVDVPMDNWWPMYRNIGVPERPADDQFDLDGKTVKLKPEDEPTRREGIRQWLEGIIGPRIYQGKVRGQSRLGFYRKNNGEVRVKNFDDVEVMAHEMAHWLDMYYGNRKRFTSLYRDKRHREEVEALSYTSQKKLRGKEGFAEFIRLWLTQYSVAKERAPLFTEAFNKELAKDKSLDKKLRKLREEMHKWYLQGPMAQLIAKSGNELSMQERIIRYLHTRPAEMARQKMIDRIHAAKVVERTIRGDIGDASDSAYKMFQMINGAESLHEAIVRDGTPELMEDGSYQFNGKSLSQVFEPAAKHGAKRFNQLMEYFKARRADELMKQGRERLFTKQEIAAGLKLGVQYPEFVKTFEEFQAFNQRMLDFYEQMGLITKDQRDAFAEMNQNYVPFHRVIERLEDGEGGGTSQIGRRLQGGTQNVRDIASNIVDGLFANVRASLLARAKRQLYTDILESQDGSLFAAKIAPDSRLVKVELSQMADRVANAMAEAGVTISKNGMIISQDADSDTIVDVDEIRQALEDNPKLLTFWTHGHKPNTLETYVDNVVINGKKVWFEVRDPLLVDMFTGMRGLKTNAFTNAMFAVKNTQTRLVTSMLQFLGPNAVRDTVSAAVLSRNKFIPVYDTLRGMGHVMFNTDTWKQFRLQGGGYGTRIEARTEERRSRRQLDLPSQNLWDMTAKFLAGWDRFTSMFEYGSRVGDFARGVKAGKNQLETAWEAREVATDFSKMGNNEMWATYLRMVPFMNAGIQGLDKTARTVMEIKGEMKGKNLTKLDEYKAQFLMKGSMLTALTVILWLINDDDERYQALTPDQKARFWWVFIPGVDEPVKIPRPYDIGHIFATIPEVALDYVKERDGKEAAETLAWTFANTLGVGDYPGILQPFIEVERNEKFTGAPVVPYRLQNLPPEYQYVDRTPQIYRSVGEALGVSPLVAEHYTKGFLRYVEAYMVDASEALLWNEDEWGERPFQGNGPTDYLTHQFRGQKVPYRTKWIEGYYNLRQRVQGAQERFRQLQDEAIRDQAGLREFAQDEVNVLLASMSKAIGTIDRAFADQNTIIASIKYNEDLSAEEKEQRIERYYQQKNQILEQFYRQVEQELREVENKLEE